MGQTEHEAQLRQQIFLFAIGIFLVVYAIALYRFRSFEWAMIASSVTFAVTVGAGALLASFVKLKDDVLEAEAEPDAPTAAPAQAGNVVDFQSNRNSYGLDEDDQAAD